MHQWSPVIIAHTLVAFAAFLIGMGMLARRKGDSTHRLIGRIWVGLLSATALSSFFIKTSGQFSWIHLLSVTTLVFIVRGVLHARNGRIEHHKYTMISLYIGSLIIAGLFTFAPGRLLNRLVFGT
jgi:uncharacterized membrane protein